MITRWISPTVTFGPIICIDQGFHLGAFERFAVQIFVLVVRCRFVVTLQKAMLTLPLLLKAHLACLFIWLVFPVLVNVLEICELRT